MSALDILETLSNAVIYAIIISPIILSVIISLHLYKNYGRLVGPIMIVILLGAIIFEYRWFYQQQAICEAAKDGNGPCIAFIFAFIFGWLIVIVLPLTFIFTIEIGRFIRKYV